MFKHSNIFECVELPEQRLHLIYELLENNNLATAEEELENLLKDFPTAQDNPYYIRLHGLLIRKKIIGR